MELQKCLQNQMHDQLQTSLLLIHVFLAFLILHSSGVQCIQTATLSPYVALKIQDGQQVAE